MTAASLRKTARRSQAEQVRKSAGLKWGKKRRLPPLVPSVKTSTYRIHDPEREEADEGYAAMRMQAVTDDEFRCCFCGFLSPGERGSPPTSYRASGFLEVHHLDDNHANNRRSNLATACPFCHSVFHCGHAAHSMTMRPIWLPWISQRQLNQLSHAITVAWHRGRNPRTETDAELGRIAGELHDALSRCVGGLRANFGPVLADEPANLGSALMQLYRKSPKAYRARAKVLWGVRLLPIPSAYPRHADYWSRYAWGWAGSAKGWKRLHAQWLEKVNKQARATARAT